MSINYSTGENFHVSIVFFGLEYQSSSHLHLSKGGALSLISLSTERAPYLRNFFSIKIFDVLCSLIVILSSPVTCHYCNICN